MQKTKEFIEWTLAYVLGVAAIFGFMVLACIPEAIVNLLF